MSGVCPILAVALACGLVACSSASRSGGGPEAGSGDNRTPTVGDGSGPFLMADSAEIARRLARFLWATAPSAALVAEIETARSPAAIGEIATRMLKDAQTAAGVRAFFRWWLRLDDLPSMPKQDPQNLLTSDLRESMRHEAETLGAFVMLDGDARLESLFTAPFTFVDSRLALYYAIGGITGDAMRQVPFDTRDRVGIFGGAGVLTLVLL